VPSVPRQRRRPRAIGPARVARTSVAKSGAGVQARRSFPDFAEPVIGPATSGRTRWLIRATRCGAEGPAKCWAGSRLQRSHGSVVRSPTSLRDIQRTRMAWLEPVLLQGSRASLAPLAHSHANDLVEAVRDGELWKLWYTSIPAPDQMADFIDLRGRPVREETFRGHAVASPLR
jgi:hypothetical protein